MNDYDEFKIWYTQKAPDESEVTMVDMAAMAWQAARAASPKVPQGVEEWIEKHQQAANASDTAPAIVFVDNLRAYLSGMAIVPVVGKDSFVQLVPDHCDRIVWRGSYHHLPLAAVKAAIAASQGDQA